jgi:hypothetical protein
MLQWIYELRACLDPVAEAVAPVVCLALLHHCVTPQHCHLHKQCCTIVCALFDPKESTRTLPVGLRGPTSTDMTACTFLEVQMTQKSIIMRDLSKEMAAVLMTTLSHAHKRA